MLRYRWISLLLLIVLVLLAGLALQAQNPKPSAVISHFNSSIAAEEKSNYADALTEMEAVSEEGKDDYAVNLRLGWLYYQTKNYGQSEKYYRQALALSGQKSVEALLGLSLPLAAKPDWKGVENVYERVLAMDPANYTANLHLGQILMNRGDFARAESLLGTALEHYPATYEVVLSSAWNSYSLGRMRDARLLFERTLMLSPGDTSAQRGLSYLK
jgi:tetratricopeptide (TPR) repeat protein